MPSEADVTVQAGIGTPPFAPELQLTWHRPQAVQGMPTTAAEMPVAWAHQQLLHSAPAVTFVLPEPPLGLLMRILAAHAAAQERPCQQAQGMPTTAA